MAAEVGFLCEKSPLVGKEAQAALALCAQQAKTSVLVADGKGGFVGKAGAKADLAAFPVVWFHQGDHTQQSGPVYSAATLTALRAHVQAGNGLLLSGAALAMVELLGIEPVSPRRGGPGNDRAQAALVPVVRAHPIFRELQPAGGQIGISDAGYPAFADFHASGGPAGGMLLARTPGGSENPLVEYKVGKGRIIAMGWRLPHYAHSPNRYRPNLEKLTANILAYLGNKEAWQEVKVTRLPGAPVKDTKVTEKELAALSLAIEDLTRTFGAAYAGRTQFSERLASLGKAVAGPAADLAGLRKRFDELQRRALLANPLIAKRRLLAIRRRAGRLGLPQNWQSNSSLPKGGYDNELVVVSLPEDGDEQALATTFFRPPDGSFVGDVDLHFDAAKLLFSKSDPKGPWRIAELDLATKQVLPVQQIDEPDVDNYDACYLPDGNILFTSTAPFVGVPCVQGASHVANLFLLRKQSGDIRQLTFDQDHDWCPTVLNNGRVLYLRWEYSDLPHFVSRILFHMNPDGTEQMEYYGSNSYWPNAMFYARPIPWHPSRFVAVVGGHHDDPRMGELVLFDPAQGRHEAAGVVQRITGQDKDVSPIILDGLVKRSWPKFLHPYPLGGTRDGLDRDALQTAAGKYFLVSARPDPRSRWGIYLADVFGNLVRIIDQPGYAFLEPILLAPTIRPPVIPAKVEETRPDALVFLQDIHRGPGLAGIPRGEVKKLRLFTYHFAYHGMGGQVNRVGLDGPWDVKRVLGTVPVEADGSAFFRVPANTPIAVQPLDKEGKALQLMRSWFTAMPGESVSCVGCHEKQNTPPTDRRSLAIRRDASDITPWYGPARGFSFVREVQPVLDRHCISCHNGQPKVAGKAIPDLRAAEPVYPQGKANSYKHGTRFTPSYLALCAYVRSATIESDIHLLPAGEFHADTTRLVQMLRDGHHGVQLEREAWDRIITWIDLNTPAHGTWAEIVGEKRVFHQRQRRQALLARYAGRDENPEAVPETICFQGLPAKPPRRPAHGSQRSPDLPRPAPPFSPTPPRELDLGGGVTLTMVRIPASGGALWIGRSEITNAQFARFDATHDSRLEHGDFLQFSVRARGYPVNQPRQPVVRVSWNRATAFCEWLSARTGQAFSLPTEQEWELACRAGTQSPMWYGALATDFGKMANLADSSLRNVDTFGFGLPSGAIPPWRPAVTSVNDTFHVSAPVESFQANPWGLHDMHGNVAEWTKTPAADDRMVVRGGSWYDRPERAQSGSRTSHRRYLGAFDIGLRVVSHSP